MGMLNRRDMVMGVGAVTGLSTLGPVRAIAAVDEAELRVADVLERIHLAGARESAFLARSSGASAPVPIPSDATARQQRPVEPSVVVKADAEGKPFAYGLKFTCDPQVVNRLMVGGRPLVARRICYSAAEVSWAPGVGLPVYDAYSPRYEYGSGYYREAKWHQIVPLIQPYGYFAGCQASEVCEASTAGQVCFDVNDSDYSDNLGYYSMTIWSWS